MPIEYTYDGQEVSPPLAWAQVPSSAKALALVVDDPDAPGGTYTHWVVLDVPTSTTSVDRGQAPVGGIESANSDGESAYAGPCPPSGSHRYRFTVYALDEPTGLPAGGTLTEALGAIDAHTLAAGRLTTIYSR